MNIYNTKMNFETLFIIVIILSIFFYYVMTCGQRKENKEYFTQLQNLKIQNNSKRHNKNNSEEGFENQSSNNNLINDNKAVLIFFYSKTCPYCIDFIPTWEKLKKMKTPNVDFNSVEESNDINDDFIKYNIKYLPTVILQFEGKNDFNTYKGDRSIEDIIKFVRLNGINLNTTILEGFVNNNNNNDDDEGYKCGDYKKFEFEKGIFTLNKKTNRFILEMEDYTREIDADVEFVNPAYFLVSLFIDKLRAKNMNDNEIALELNKCKTKMFIKNLNDYGLCYNNTIEKLKDEYKNNKSDIIKLELIETKVCNNDNYLIHSRFDPTTIGN